ncbi:MAG: 4a-hydroxytetrahydrobiopterin dehydratase [Spirochaetia bacterium]|nr:4a-hydroxytetrahydrobiopterin dehydratase [Spirochaetia bacterium]
MNSLASRSCKPIPKGSPALDVRQANEWQKELNANWKILENPSRLSREFRFKTYAETIAFVNQVASLAEKNDHHPDLGVHWGRCVVDLSTHSVGGLSENDFILAAKIDGISG